MQVWKYPLQASVIAPCHDAFISQADAAVRRRLHVALYFRWALFLVSRGCLPYLFLTCSGVPATMPAFFLYSWPDAPDRPGLPERPERPERRFTGNTTADGDNLLAET